MVLRQDRVYSHATAHFNYTSYDLRREQDIIHPSTGKSNILVHTPVNAVDNLSYPWLYAHVLGIYHTNIYLPGASQHERVEFLHVRWYQYDTTWSNGALARRLERIHPVPYSSTDTDAPSAFGFVDPSHVIRACHLIPAFRYGHTTEYLQPSLARDNYLHGDWKYLYVNRYASLTSIRTNYLTVLISFVDRDMFVRYLGCGIGHLDLGAPNIEQILRDGFDVDAEGAMQPSSANEAEAGDAAESDDDSGGEGGGFLEAVGEAQPAR